MSRPLNPALHKALVEPIQRLPLAVIIPFSLHGNLIVILLVKKWKSLQLIKFNLIKLVFFGIPQIVENPIDLYDVSHLYIHVAVLMGHIGVVKHIDAVRLELFYELLMIFLRIELAARFLGFSLHLQFKIEI